MVIHAAGFVSFAPFQTLRVIDAATKRRARTDKDADPYNISIRTISSDLVGIPRADRTTDSNHLEVSVFQTSC